MIASSETWEDVDKYYRHTYIKYKDFGDTLLKIYSVSPNGVNLVDLSGVEYYFDFESGDYQLDYILPKRTSFQYKSHAVHLSRIPARMWKKGLCDKNTYMRFLRDTGNWTALPLDLETISGFIHKPVYPSLTDALHNFKTDLWSSAALSPRISICKLKNFIYVDTLRVGSFKRTSKVVVSNPLLKEELLSVFKGYSHVSS